MFKTEGSKAQVNLIEFLQKKNCERDPGYVPQAFHKPDKSLLRRWFDFMNPFYHPAELKPCGGLKGVQGQPTGRRASSSKRLQKAGTVTG